MNRLIVNTQSLAQRCEICHQSDSFNPFTNYCQRCASVLVPFDKNLNSPLTDQQGISPQLIRGDQNLQNSNPLLKDNNFQTSNTDINQLCGASLLLIMIGWFLDWILPSFAAGTVVIIIGSLSFIFAMVMLGRQYHHKLVTHQRLDRFSQKIFKEEPFIMLMRVRPNLMQWRQSFYVALYQSIDDLETRPTYHLIIDEPHWSIPAFAQQPFYVEVFLDPDPKKGAALSHGIMIKTAWGIIFSPFDISRKNYATKSLA